MTVAYRKLFNRRMLFWVAVFVGTGAVYNGMNYAVSLFGGDAGIFFLGVLGFFVIGDILLIALVTQNHGVLGEHGSELIQAQIPIMVLLTFAFVGTLLSGHADSEILASHDFRQSATPIERVVGSAQFVVFMVIVVGANIGIMYALMGNQNMGKMSDEFLRSIGLDAKPFDPPPASKKGQVEALVDADSPDARPPLPDLPAKYKGVESDFFRDVYAERTWGTTAIAMSVGAIPAGTAFGWLGAWFSDLIRRMLGRPKRRKYY